MDASSSKQLTHPCRASRPRHIWCLCGSGGGLVVALIVFVYESKFALDRCFFNLE